MSFGSSRSSSTYNRPAGYGWPAVLSLNTTDKILSTDEQLHRRLRAAPRPLVFTNGCFDILHRGHVAYLEEAAALGRTLFVAVNSDASVTQLGKDGNRPINPLDDRMALLAALGFVDLVMGFEEATPIELIRQVRPDHLVKGGDWPADQIVGAQLVEKYGGQAHSIPIRHERSTSALLQRIRGTEPDHGGDAQTVEPDNSLP